MKGLRGCHIGQGRGRSAGSHLPLRRPPAHRPAARPLRRPCSCSAVSNATDALTAEQQSTWDACRQHLLDMGVKDETEADKILRQSFGWAGQAFWSSEKVRAGPARKDSSDMSEKPCRACTPRAAPACTPRERLDGRSPRKRVLCTRGRLRRWKRCLLWSSSTQSQSSSPPTPA